MGLRNWQEACLRKVLHKYSTKGQHFLCLATPGAGKTRMAAEVVSKLFSGDKIDFVICFTPSVVTSTGMQKALEEILQAPLNGRIGAKGDCVTYQSLNHKDMNFWNVLRDHRVLAVFDEIHHCGGNELGESNVWAQHILLNVQKYARYTLALSGTPWRSDNKQVTLSKYSDVDGKILCDYEYGLSQAINDNVCRTPIVTVIDNECIVTSNDIGTEEVYSSIESALKCEVVSYQDIIETPSVIDYCLKQALSKLRLIKKQNQNAAGLVIASTVEHAYQIASVLEHKLNRSVTIVNYHNSESQNILTGFQHSTTEWLVAVGMVSEGTNIPRLQVCCHLTRIKTELHFRQVLGRILRLTFGEKNTEAHLFSPALPQLIEYSNRLNNEIPVVCEINHLTNQKTVKLKTSDIVDVLDNNNPSIVPIEAKLQNVVAQGGFDLAATSTLDDSFYRTIMFKGPFTKSIIQLSTA